MIEHTPGEWELTSSADPDQDLSIIGRGPVVSGVIASIRTQWMHEPQRREQNANADLLALAPTAPHECSDPDCPGNRNRLKLAAGEELLSWLKTLRDNCLADREFGWEGPDAEWVRQVNAAIAAWECRQ